jgi:hypothetical protein
MDSRLAHKIFQETHVIRAWEPYASPKWASSFGFGTSELMIPQPSKIFEGRSHELMRVIDLGIQHRSLSAVRSNLGREALSALAKSYFGRI